LCWHNPGWPTVEEAAKLIEEGHGGRLMRLKVGDADKAGDTYLLCPAKVGAEGQFNDRWWGIWKLGDGNPCVFLCEGKCTIHSMKPKECAHTRATACESGHGVDIPNEKYYPARRALVVNGWRTKVGRALVDRWTKEFEFKEG
jgi:Fe-S-cluster containining protein